MSHVKINGSPFKHSLGPSALAEALQHLHDAQQVTKTRASTLKQAVDGQNAGAIELATDAYLNSPEVILACAIAANARMKPKKRATLETCLALPSGFSISEPIHEDVLVFPKPKSGGDFRVLQDFGLKRRTAQEMASRVISAHLKLKPGQFALQGPQKAIQLVKSLAAAGHVHAAHFDVRDHYGSFTLEKLVHTLPLPPGVVRNAVVGRYMEHKPAPGMHGHKVHGQKGKYGPHFHSSSMSHATSPLVHSLLTQARLGIPQGSGSSPKVAEFCTSHLTYLNVNVPVVNYADNFLLLAKSKEALTAAEGELAVAVGDLPGGSFKSALKDRRNLQQGLTFLGHELQIKGGMLQVWPSHRSGEELSARLIALDQSLQQVLLIGSQMDKSFLLDRLARMHATLKGWRSAFSACTQIDDVMAHDWVTAGEWLNMFNLTWDEVEKHVTPDMKYTPSLSSIGHTH